MEVLPFRRLVTGPAPTPDRVVLHEHVVQGPQQPAVRGVDPAPDRLDRFLLTASERRIPRGLQYRAFRYSRSVRNPIVMQLASRRYRGMFTADPEQIRWFRGPVVADIDDPYFTQAHVDLLNRPNLVAYVVTAERAARRYEEMGVRERPST